MTTARSTGPLLRAFFSAFIPAGVLFLSPLHAAPREQYRYEVTMAGLPVGAVDDVWEEVVENGACIVRLTSSLRLTIPRGESELAIGTTSITEADCVTYHPRSLRVTRDEGGGTLTTTASREGEYLVVTAEKGGIVEKKRLALTKESVFFGMLFRKYPNDFFVGKGSVPAISEEGVAERSVSFEGRRTGDMIEVTVNYEGVSLLFSVRGPVVIATVMNGGMIAYRLSAGNEEKNATIVSPPRDILTATALANEGLRVARPREARRLTVQIAGAIPPIPEACGQTVGERGGETLTVTIAAGPCPGPFTASDLAATLYENKDDPAVTKAAARWKGIADRARLLREVISFVNRHISDKNYRHGTLSASETLAARAGDCTEHAVLAVALLRALGIPARNLYGLVLSGDGRFFFHQWIEAYTGDAWMAADPTFGSVPADAARIVLSRGNDASLEQRENLSLATLRTLQGTRLSVVGMSYE